MYFLSSKILVFTGSSIHFIVCLGFTSFYLYAIIFNRFECIGNAYVYVYTSIGEFPAILIATFMCSEMTLALPMIAHGVGQNLDAAFFNNRYLIGCHLPFTKVAHLLPTQNVFLFDYLPSGDGIDGQLD